MSGLFNLVQQIFDFILILWGFVLGLINDLLYVIQLVPKVILKLPMMLEAFLPQSIVAILMTFVAVTVIYRIMGRD